MEKPKYEYRNGKLERVVMYSRTYYKCCQKIYLHECNSKYCNACPEHSRWIK